MRRTALVALAAGGATLAVLALTDGLAALAGVEVVVAVLAFLAFRRLLPLAAAIEPEDGPRPFRWRGRWQPSPSLPASLRRDEVLLHYGPKNAATADHRLLPHLQHLAQERLAAFHGVDPVTQPQAARQLLGPAAWELLRPDRPHPDDPFAPGPELQALEQAVAAIERLEELWT